MISKGQEKSALRETKHIPSSLRIYFNAKVKPVSFFSTIRTLPKAPLPTTRSSRNWFKFTIPKSVKSCTEYIFPACLAGSAPAATAGVWSAETRSGSTYPHCRRQPVSLGNFPSRTVVVMTTEREIVVSRHLRQHPIRTCIVLPRQIVRDQSWSTAGNRSGRAGEGVEDRAEKGRRRAGFIGR